MVKSCYEYGVVNIIIKNPSFLIILCPKKKVSYKYISQ